MDIVSDIKNLILQGKHSDLEQTMFTHTYCVNAKYDKHSGRSLLHLACEIPDKKSVELLLCVGADPNTQDSTGCSPLHIAAQKANIEICKLLLESGANVRIKDYSGHEPFQAALESGNKELIKYLREHAYPKHR